MIFKEWKTKKTYLIQIIKENKTYLNSFLIGLGYVLFFLILYVISGAIIEAIDPDLKFWEKSFIMQIGYIIYYLIVILVLLLIIWWCRYLYIFIFGVSIIATVIVIGLAILAYLLNFPF